MTGAAIGARYLELDEVHSFKLKELDRLSCDLAPGGAAFLSEADILLPLDNLSDAQCGKFDLHVLESHWENWF